MSCKLHSRILHFGGCLGYVTIFAVQSGLLRRHVVSAANAKHKTLAQFEPWSVR